MSGWCRHGLQILCLCLNLMEAHVGFMQTVSLKTSLTLPECIFTCSDSCRPELVVETGVAEDCTKAS